MTYCFIAVAFLNSSVVHARANIPFMTRAGTKVICTFARTIVASFFPETETTTRAYRNIVQVWYGSNIF